MTHAYLNRTNYPQAALVAAARLPSGASYGSSSLPALLAGGPSDPPQAQTPLLLPHADSGSLAAAADRDPALSFARGAVTVIQAPRRGEAPAGAAGGRSGGAGDAPRGLVGGRTTLLLRGSGDDLAGLGVGADATAAGHHGDGEEDEGMDGFEGDQDTPMHAAGEADAAAGRQAAAPPAAPPGCVGVGALLELLIARPDGARALAAALQLTEECQEMAHDAAMLMRWGGGD